jgi:hypothetical protein
MDQKQRTTNADFSKFLDWREFASILKRELLQIPLMMGLFTCKKSLARMEKSSDKALSN